MRRTPEQIISDLDIRPVGKITVEVHCDDDTVLFEDSEVFSLQDGLRVMDEILRETEAEENGN